MTKDVAFKVFGGELCCRCLCIMTPENDANLPEASLSSDYNHKICNSCVEETDYDWSDELMCKVSDDIEPFRMEYEKEELIVCVKNLLIGKRGDEYMQLLNNLNEKYSN